MKRIAAFALLTGLSASALAFEPFTISDIRVEGLQRISAGTVFTYLTVEKGDRLDSGSSAEAIRALFRTGFFKDVAFERQGDILVIRLAERPSISKITVVGNKDIKSEELLKGLAEIGLAEGEVFDRIQIERVTSELTRQYYNRGKYNVSVTPTINELDRNRVDISIVIAEGKASKIKHINIVGNKSFTDDEIRDEFESDTTGWLSWYKRDDQYSREKLTGDLEKLRSFYLDRGYVDFSVESTQVTISPDKRHMYITANVREGEVYNIREVKLTGDLIMEEDVARRFVRMQSGEVFSRKKIEQTTQALTRVLGNLGYAFADVTPIPNIDKDKREVDLTLLVNPGKRVYVRRIVFNGNFRTEDEVLRREMRQFEGGWFSQAALDRSKIRLQRLGYFQEVNVETPKVPGTDDQVDMVVNVEERASGSFSFGLGYSEFQGLITSVALTQNNFLGQGDRVGVSVSNNKFYSRFDANYIQPYFTDDGVSLGYNLRYSELDQGDANIASYTTDVAEFATVLGIPVTETDTINFKLGFDHTKIGVFQNITPDIIYDFVDENGSTFNALRSEISWARDTRNKFFVPTDGGLQRVALEFTYPKSTLQYYKLFYQNQRFWPMTEKLTFMLNGEVGYGDGYGRDQDLGLPFFEYFYAGGVRSVRGFEDNTLGPRDGEFDEPIGGALRVIGNAEIIFPVPFTKDMETTRLSWFLDAGQVYTDWDAFDAGELRYSTGLSFQWQAPVGPIIINFGVPLNKKDGDETESLQFSFGGQF